MKKARRARMGNLATCMIRRIDLNDDDLLMETNGTANVVVVSDALCIGYQWSDDAVSFEEDEAPYRAVYCNKCWDKLAAYSWKLTLMEREARGDWSKEIAQ